ncbi:helix-turn-helix domain-containing protein [Streptomyces platensis]|uniref:helix-turn-helix domain-containing protein n=1 Tax=Streptomyces platensis TaxID=58346 RepID=UPI0039B794C5
MKVDLVLEVRPVLRHPCVPPLVAETACSSEILATVTSPVHRAAHNTRVESSPCDRGTGAHPAAAARRPAGRRGDRRRRARAGTGLHDARRRPARRGPCDRRLGSGRLLHLWVPTARSPPPISGGSAESRRRGPRTAARRLGLHPQSLRYRLRRIADLTHRDPRDPWQRLTLDIARTIGH